MLQEFFKTSIYCKAIKYMLSQTPLPMYRTITADEWIIQGCVYIYKDKILRCTKSGRFRGIHSMDFVDDHLYVSEHITVSNDPDYIQRRVGPYEFEYDYLTVTDDNIRQFYRPFAEYVLIDDFKFGRFVPGLTSYYNSNVNYYDSDTHKYLGEYLRCLRDIQGIDLMSLYNCFNHTFVDNVHITSDSVNYLTEIVPTGNKVTLVPIKFNKDYTIAINCPFKVKLKSVFYKDYLMRDSGNERLLCEKLNESYVTFNNITYKYPVKYKLDVDDKDLIKYENYLYLAIEFPDSINSSITVLEGDYTNNSKEYISDLEAMNSIPDVNLSTIFKSDVGLLSYDDNKHHPFSDKLMSYLVGSTIDSRDLINENISYIQEKVNYHPKYKGHWDNKLRYILYRGFMSLGDNVDVSKVDVLGFVDKDMEKVVNKGYIING